MGHWPHVREGKQKPTQSNLEVLSVTVLCWERAWAWRPGSCLVFPKLSGVGEAGAAGKQLVGCGIIDLTARPVFVKL